MTEKDIHKKTTLTLLKFIQICRTEAREGHHIVLQSVPKSTILKRSQAEKIWPEFRQALNTPHFDIFIENLHKSGILKIILPDIEKLWTTPEKPKYHPEGNSGDHTLLTIRASQQKDPLITFALLLHDVGKTRTRSDILPSHHGHEKLGLPVIERICHTLEVPDNFKRFALLCCKNHMNFFNIPDMKPATLYAFLKEVTHNFRDMKTFERFVEVCRCDNYGRALQLSPQDIKRHNDSVQLCRKSIHKIQHIDLAKMPHLKELMPSKDFSQRVREYIIFQMHQK